MVGFDLVDALLGEDHFARQYVLLVQVDEVFQLLEVKTDLGWVPTWVDLDVGNVADIVACSTVPAAVSSLACSAKQIKFSW